MRGPTYLLFEAALIHLPINWLSLYLILTKLKWYTYDTYLRDGFTMIGNHLTTLCLFR